MADDLTKSTLTDRSRINTGEEYEVHYWSRYFGVTPDQLRAAVKKVGVRVRDVEAELLKSPRQIGWGDSISVRCGRAGCLHAIRKIISPVPAPY